ncbi:MAG: PAS domain-containing protein [Minwuia sp.]|nr:PAS domain-containing protein [Minwuia sp.]
MDVIWQPFEREYRSLGVTADFNIDLALEFDNRLPDSLLALWASRHSDGRLPARTDFDMASLRPYLGWLCLQRVTPDRSDMVLSLVGTKIVENVGRDSTGRTLSEILPAGVRNIAMQLLRYPRPLRLWGAAAWRRREYLRHEALMLPLAHDGIEVDQAMILAQFYRSPDQPHRIQA